MRKVTESNEMGDKKSNAKGESPHLIAARIHAILARESDTAIVFRRGPSNKTAILKWDLQTDSFDLGQWFYGSFYPYRCDISPDGRHLVYFAAKYGRGSSMDEYIESRIKAELGEISWFHGGQYYQRMERIVNDSATRRERASDQDGGVFGLQLDGNITRSVFEGLFPLVQWDRLEWRRSFCRQQKGRHQPCARRFCRKNGR